MNHNLTGTLVRESGAALLIRRNGKEEWIPRSIVDHLSKSPPDAKNEREITFTLPAWKANQLGTNWQE